MDDAIDKVNEPQGIYGKRKSEEVSISFYASLNQQEEEHFKWLASLTAEQHLINAIANIKRIYAKELSTTGIRPSELRFE
jgi:hypothetical protein